MFRSKKIHLSESIVTAQAAILQAIEVIKGYTIIVRALEITPGEIENVDLPPDNAGNMLLVGGGSQVNVRTVSIKGSNRIPYLGKPRDYLEFSTIVPIKLVEGQYGWQIVEGKRFTIMISQLEKQFFFSVHWEYLQGSNRIVPLVHTFKTETPLNDESGTEWAVGTSWSDRKLGPDYEDDKLTLDDTVPDASTT